MSVLDPALPMRLLIAYGLILLIIIGGLVWTPLAVRRHRRKRQTLSGYCR
jgi:hypothetical protein